MMEIPRSSFVGLRALSLTKERTEVRLQSLEFFHSTELVEV